MEKYRVIGVCVSLLVMVLGGVVYADELSINAIQSNTSDGDASVYDGQIHNCDGGIVTHIWHGFNDRVYLQDPAHPTWGAIVVKDAEGGELSNNVSVGDWVSFDNIYIEEYRGTTFLQYRRSFSEYVSFTVESNGNAVPDPVLLTAADLAAPVEDPPGEWYVTDHSSEQYESMIATMEDVIVGAMDYGKAEDNYWLWQGTDAAWGTDYMNIDAGGPYHPYTRFFSGNGRPLDSITGVVEQYTKVESGWDYYQLNTRFDGDIVPEPGTLALLLVGMGLARRRR